jgi:hypothetical protein
MVTKIELGNMLSEVTELTKKLDSLTGDDNMSQIASQLSQVSINQTLGENLTFEHGLDIAERAIKNFSPADTPEIEQWLNRILQLAMLLKQLKRNDTDEQ